jgi:hypothetical protein
MDADPAHRWLRETVIAVYRTAYPRRRAEAFIASRASRQRGRAATSTAAFRPTISAVSPGL